MRSGAWRECGLIALTLYFTTLAAVAGTTSSEVQEASSYAGSRDREYQVYTPDGITGQAPMVMALHGCQQTNADVLNDWGLKAAADRHGFILVVPFITSYDGLRNTNCWGFWLDQHQHQGMGEPEDLHQIALTIERDFSIDPNRRYITGLSSGGAMAAVAATTHNEYWAAAASAAGLPYGEDAASVSLSGQCPGFATFHSVNQVADDMRGELNDSYPIPLLVLQNNNDCTVVQPAGRNLRDAHLLVFGEATFDTPAEAQSTEEACEPVFQDAFDCRHSRYTQDGSTASRSIVETVFFDGPIATANPTDTDHGHYWVGGEAGNEGAWAARRGPSYPDIIWDFFTRHARGVSIPVGQPQITLNGENPLTVVLGSTFTDPGATAQDFEDGSLAVEADCNAVDMSTAGEYVCVYSTTDSDGNSAELTRIVRVVDPETPTESCITITDSPYGHMDNDRAVAGGIANLRTLSKTDRQDIGAVFDTWSQVSLYEGEPGDWYAREPEACRSGDEEAAICEDWYASNLQHSASGRAYYAAGYYTVAGDDYLGPLAGAYRWVHESTPGLYEAGQCM